MWQKTTYTMKMSIQTIQGGDSDLKKGSTTTVDLLHLECRKFGEEHTQGSYSWHAHGPRYRQSHPVLRSQGVLEALHSSHRWHWQLWKIALIHGAASPLLKPINIEDAKTQSTLSSFAKGSTYRGLTAPLHTTKQRFFFYSSSSFLELFVGINCYYHHCQLSG